MNTPLHSPFREIVAYLPGIVRSSFYEGYFAQFYSHYTSLIESDIEWYRDRIGRGRGKRVLDLFSGTGRIAKRLTEDGHYCTAIEKSPDMMIDESTNNAGVRMLLGDVFEHLEQEGYDAAIAGQMSLAMFLSVSERRDLLRHIGSNLRKGGRLVFDMPLASDSSSSEVVALPLFDNARGYVLSGVFRDMNRRTQTTYFLAELDAPDSPTSRILAHHELALLTEDELRDELNAGGFRTEVLDVFTPTPLQANLSARIARISAVKDDGANLDN